MNDAEDVLARPSAHLLPRLAQTIRAAVVATFSGVRETSDFVPMAAAQPRARPQQAQWGDRAALGKPESVIDGFWLQKLIPALWRYRRRNRGRT